MRWVPWSSSTPPRPAALVPRHGAPPPPPPPARPRGAPPPPPPGRAARVGRHPMHRELGQVPAPDRPLAQPLLHPHPHRVVAVLVARHHDATVRPRGQGDPV